VYPFKTSIGSWRAPSLFLLLFLLLAPLAWSQVAPELVGKYQMEMQGGETMELRADGTATVGGEETRWAARANQLAVGTDVMPYVYQGGRLTLSAGPIRLTWMKVSGPPGKSPTAASAQKGLPNTTPPTAPPPAGNAQDTQYRQILMSSAWCSFTYNKVSGTSATRRVVLRPDGIMTVNGGAETYSSGNGGTVAGQSSNGSTMRWKYEGLRLYLDDGSGAGFQDVGLTASRNSNGSIILMAAGREYAMCR
jgi:hypothetical protein